MPICYPQVPDFASDAESDVWHLLVNELPDRAMIIANWERAERIEEYESDFIVVWPGKGIFLIEVKGGHITQEADASWWTTNKHGERNQINPFHQARRNAHEIERFVERSWSQGHLGLPWLVVFPHTELPAGFTTAEAAPERIVDSAQLSILIDRLKGIAHDGAASHATTTRCEAFVHAMVDVRDPQQALIEADETRSRRIRALTEEQYEKLEEMADNERFAITGPAGSGKTYLALELARRRAAAGERVAIVCYSKGLSEFLIRATKGWREDEPKPAFVGTFHLLGAMWGVSAPDNVPDGWWIDESAELMRWEAEQLSEHERFDTVIVDEGQDFKASWWNALTASLRDPEHGGLFVFGDMDQNVFDRDEFKVLGLATSRLTRNMRNSRPIAEAAALLSSSKSKHLGIEGPAIRFEQCTADKAQLVAEDVVEGLMHAKWDAKDIAFLTTQHRHEVRLEYEADTAEEKIRRKEEYWDDFWEGSDVFYATVQAFKGLERRVVVLAVDGRGDRPRAKEALYTGMTRARDLLVVCGDINDIRLAGGNELASLLQLHAHE